MIEPLGGYQQTPTPKGSRKGIYLLVAFLVLIPIGILLLVGGGVASMYLMSVKTTEEYECAISTLRASPDAKRLLGEPMEPSFFATGAFSLKSNDRHVTFTTKVTGPKASGDLSVVSVRDASSSDLLMSLEVGGQRTAIHTDKYPCSK